MYEVKIPGLDSITVKDLNLNGYDLLQIGIPEGIEIGTILNLVLQKVTDGELRNEKEVLLDYVEQFRRTDFRI